MSQNYTVCVRVVNCKGQPVEGAVVTVGDVDVLQPDPLPSSSGQKTGPDGVLCLQLKPSEFEVEPFPGWEPEAGTGPNLYFSVASVQGNLDEQPSAGWAPSRRVKSGETLWVALMVCKSERIRPVFTHVGDFGVGIDFNSFGMTNNPKNGHGGPNYAFHRTLTLRGQVPARWENEQVHYRFLWTKLPLDPAVPTIPITQDLVDESVLGFRMVDWDNVGPPPPDASSYVNQVVKVDETPYPASTTGTGYGPDALVIAPGPAGWVKIPPDVTVSPDTLLRFVTTGVHPGGATTSTSASGIVGVITFEAKTASGVPLGTNSQVIAINNWDPIRSLEIVPKPCAVVHNELDLVYAFDHEFASVPDGASLTVTGNVPSTDGHDASSALDSGLRGWNGSHAVHTRPDLSNGQNPLKKWQPCPYVVNFSGSLRLTDGYVDAGSFSAPPVMFCKKKMKPV